MDIEYYKQMEPFFGSWTISRGLGEGSYGKVFEIVRTDFGKTYHSALKVITFPGSQSEIKSLIAEGMDEISVTSFYKGLVEEVASEFALMSDLKGNSNIVSYEDHMVREHKDGIGWDILIRMELLTPLVDKISKDFLPETEIVKLGIDMCRALEDCQKKNIIHRDIKPENIFISEYGSYKLGDFGVARTVEKTSSNMSKKGTYTYMAPEIYKDEVYGASVDTYSLGLVLYRLLNKHRAPFLPEYPKPISYNDKENALTRRMSGEPLPKPNGLDDGMWWIIKKAAAYLPTDRYATPTEMRHDLERVLAVLNGEDDVFTGVPIPVPEMKTVPTANEDATVIKAADNIAPNINKKAAVKQQKKNKNEKVRADKPANSELLETVNKKWKYPFILLAAFIFALVLFKFWYFNDNLLETDNIGYIMVFLLHYDYTRGQFIVSILATIPVIVIGLIQLISYLKGKGRFSATDKLILLISVAENTVALYGYIYYFCRFMDWASEDYFSGIARYMFACLLTFVSIILSIISGYMDKKGLRIAAIVTGMLGCLLQFGSINWSIALIAVIVALLEFDDRMDRVKFLKFVYPGICMLLAVLLFVFQAKWFVGIYYDCYGIIRVHSILLMAVSAAYLVYTFLAKKITVSGYSRKSVESFWGTPVYDSYYGDGQMIPASRHLDAKTVYDSVSYRPEMFYGNYVQGICNNEHLIYSDEDFAKNVKYVHSSLILNDEKEYYRGVSAVPVCIKAGNHNTCNSFRTGDNTYWAELTYLYKTHDDNIVREKRIIASYELDNNNITFHTVENYTVNADGNISYMYSGKHATYRFSFTGPALTLSDGVNSVELVSYNFIGKNNDITLDGAFVGLSNKLDGINHFRFYYNLGNKTGYSEITDSSKDSAYRNGVCVMNKDGLMQFSYTDINGQNHAYEFVYFDLFKEGMILTDGVNTYYYMT